MPKNQPVRAYPVPGMFIQGVPHVEHDCDDPLCVESGAFTTEPPTGADEPEDPAPAGPPETED